jgi:holo-[acyl-carrier protein] synthase
MSQWSVGVDIVKIDRFKHMDYLSHKRFYERTFTNNEIEYCMSFTQPAPHFAANFAGKEAIYKAINRFCEIRVWEIEILRDQNGAPFVNLFPNHKATNANKLIRSQLEVSVSLSHSISYALAFALVNHSKTTWKNELNNQNTMESDNESA